MSAITLVFLTIFLIGGEIGGYASVTATEPTCSNFGALKYLNQYNLITLGDLSTSSDVEYKTLVCGALKSSSSANFAIHLGQSETNPSTSVLEIAESITDGNALNVQVGSVAVGKSTDKIVKQGNVPYKVNNRQFNINGGNQGGQVVCDSQLAAKCARVSEDLKALSLTLSKRTPNNNIVFPTNQPGPLNINIGTKDSDGFAFLTVADGNSFFHNQKVQQIEIKNNVQASWIIINLGGKTISFDQGNIVGSLTQLDPRSRILFNFYEAERISMQRNFMGAMLAPLAAVDTNSNIDGATAVRSLTTNAELHKPLYVFPSCANVQSSTTTTTTTPKPTTTTTTTPKPTTTTTTTTTPKPTTTTTTTPKPTTTTTTTAKPTTTTTTPKPTTTTTTTPKPTTTTTTPKPTTTTTTEAPTTTTTTTEPTTAVEVPTTTEPTTAVEVPTTTEPTTTVEVPTTTEPTTTTEAPTTTEPTITTAVPTISTTVTTSTTEVPSTVTVASTTATTTTEKTTTKTTEPTTATTAKRTTKREITEKSSTTQRTQSPSTEPQNNGTSTTTKTSSTRTNTPTAVTTKLTTAKPKPTNKGSCSQSDESDDDSSDENHDRSSPKRQRSKSCSRRVRITRILSSTSGRGTSDRRCAKCALRYISFTVVLEGITLDQITNQCNKRYMEHFKQSVSNQIRKYQSNGFKSMRITSLSTDKPNSLIVELLFTVTPKYNQQITVAIQRALTSFQFDRLVDDKE